MELKNKSMKAISYVTTFINPIVEQEGENSEITEDEEEEEEMSDYDKEH
jgi:hypothetical protein